VAVAVADLGLQVAVAVVDSLRRQTSRSLLEIFTLSQSEQVVLARQIVLLLTEVRVQHPVFCEVQQDSQRMVVQVG
jgi:hypothetical protein